MLTFLIEGVFCEQSPNYFPAMGGWRQVMNSDGITKDNSTDTQDFSVQQSIFEMSIVDRQVSLLKTDEHFILNYEKLENVDGHDNDTVTENLEEEIKQSLSNIKSSLGNLPIESPSNLEDLISELFPKDNNLFKKTSSLKNRNDVVNKSILRALKRFFVNWFRREYHQPRYRNADRRTECFNSSICEFTKSFHPRSVIIKSQSGVNEYDIAVEDIF